MYGKNLWFICRYVMSRIAVSLISIEERWLSCTKLKKEVELGKSSLWIFLLFTMKVELIINSLKWSAENHNAMDYNVMSCNAMTVKLRFVIACLVSVSARRKSISA